MVALRPPLLSPSPRWPATLCRSQSRINAGTAAPGSLFYNHQNYHNGGISLATDLQWMEAAFSLDQQTQNDPRRSGSQKETHDWEKATMISLKSAITIGLVIVVPPNVDPLAGAVVQEPAAARHRQM
jgi:hypothetical protein